jgi:predicted MPP superfamily phosphohydrolase
MNPWTFVHVCDIHVGSPKSYRYRAEFNENWQTARQQIIEINPDLLIVGGDLTRDGFLHDFEMWQVKQDLDAFSFPYHAIPGNVEGGDKFVTEQGAIEKMDDLAERVSFDRLWRFQSWFGEFPWSFVHKNVRFSGFFAAVSGSGLPQEEQMWRWLEGLAALGKPKFHVVTTHFPLFINALDEPTYDHHDADQIRLWYANIDQPHRDRIMAAFKAADVDVVLSGHLHSHRIDVVDGITFIKAPATSKPQRRGYWQNSLLQVGFMRFDVTDDQLQPSFTQLTRSAEGDGYGPSGHPRPEDRDYSIARVK